MSQLEYIPVDKLDPHPDNPRRKNLGDLTELAESIKANGVLQNLTVVPWFSSITYAPIDDPAKQVEAGYRVVIGHRRLAAAKLAGLSELPCIITDMALRDQVRTMLMENIQRSDLTAYEQAQGFQMMLNLGDTVEDIAEKTGFSKSTVNRRVKLLELDTDKFKEAETRGGSLFEYMELDKIKDIERRNAVLDKIGTDNFKWALKNALDEQKKDEQIAAFIARLSEFATEVDSSNGYTNVKNYYIYDGVDKIEPPEDADTEKYYFYNPGYGTWVSLLRERAEAPEEDEGKAQRDAEEAARKERISHLDEIAKRAYELRWEFIKTVSPTTIKKNLASIVAASSWERVGSGYSRFDKNDFIELLGVERMDADDDYTPEADRAIIVEAVTAAPERALLFAAYCDFEDGASNRYFQRWRGEHEENKSLDYLYDLLGKLGYKMSDEEKSMQDGTHELFTATE